MKKRVQRLSQDNQIKQRRAWLLLEWVTAERSWPCKQPACPAIGGGSEVIFKPLVHSKSPNRMFNEMNESFDTVGEWTLKPSADHTNLVQFVYSPSALPSELFTTFLVDPSQFVFLNLVLVAEKIFIPISLILLLHPFPGSDEELEYDWKFQNEPSDTNIEGRNRHSRRCYDETWVLLAPPPAPPTHRQRTIWEQSSVKLIWNSCPEMSYLAIVPGLQLNAGETLPGNFILWIFYSGI
ncbi:hypothetical protein J6590_034088 [Homalodisca vitripennis]|nr:hypothetical protein J6590_034088 [Homalodisca vitripennis]